MKTAIRWILAIAAAVAWAGGAWGADGAESAAMRLDMREGLRGRIATAEEAGVAGTEWVSLTNGAGRVAEVWVPQDVRVVGGVLPEDGRWDAKTPVLVRDDVIVGAGRRLTIEAGAEVLFAAGSKIVVREGGRLVVKGAHFDEARWTWKDEGDPAWPEDMLRSRAWNRLSPKDMTHWVEGMGTGEIAEVVFFDKFGKTCPARVYTAGERYGKLPKLSREGYAFKGWRNSKGETVKAKDPVRLDQVRLRAELVALTAKFVLEAPNLLAGRLEPTCSVGREAGCHEVKVKANTSWAATVRTGATWLRVEPESGKGDGTVRLIVDENRSPERRFGEVLLSTPVFAAIGKPLHLSAVCDLPFDERWRPSSPPMPKMQGISESPAGCALRTNPPPMPKMNGFSECDLLVVVQEGMEKLEAPTIEPGDGAVFRGTRKRVRLAHADEGAEIRFTTDGSEVTPESRLYEKPFWVTKTAEVRARAYREDRAPSDEARARIVRRPKLTGIRIEGPDEPDVTAETNYRCFAEYADGSEREVTAAWAKVQGKNGEGALSALYMEGGTAKCALKTVKVRMPGVTISQVTARPRWPWEGMVDIEYTVKTSGENVRAAIRVTGFDEDHGTELMARTMTGDGAVAAVGSGRHRVTWNVGVDYPGLHTTAFKVRVEGRPVPAARRGDAEAGGKSCVIDLSRPGNPTYVVRRGGRGEVEWEYCVVDLSGGPEAKRYPVEYREAEPEGGFNTDEYKTTKLVLKRCPAGTFRMHSVNDDNGGGRAQETEGDVTLAKAFYMGLFEVTQEQWRRVMGTEPSGFKGAKRPVENVSYNMIRGMGTGAEWPTNAAVDGESFLGKLRAKTELAFDLPTEAQWEYACRAGTATRFSYGDAADGGYMWFDGNSAAPGAGAGAADGMDCRGAVAMRQSRDVGAKKPNPWGLYDMHGNVWEWCLDWYGPLAFGEDPAGAGQGTSRVKRGGSWGHPERRSTSLYRNGADGPSFFSHDGGFRLSLTEK